MPGLKYSLCSFYVEKQAWVIILICYIIELHFLKLDYLKFPHNNSNP